MTTDSERPALETVERLTEYVSRLADAQADHQVELFDALRADLSTLGTQVEAADKRSAYTGSRLHELTEAIIAMAGLDFDSPASIYGDGGPFDAIATGLMLLGEELQESTVSRAYVEGILASMADVLIVVGANGTIKTANAAACDQLGYPVRELVGMPFENLVETMPDAGGESIATQLQRGPVDLCFSHKEGPGIPMQARGSLLSEAGEEPYTIVVARDMSETHRRLAAEAATAAAREKQTELTDAYHDLRDAQYLLVQTEKLTALGELSAGVAHELNQPLNNIKITAQSVLRDIDQQRFDIESISEETRDIVQLVDRAAGIVDHLRRYARKSIGDEMVTFDVNDCVKGALQLIEGQLRMQEVNVEVDLSGELPALRGDPMSLEQVFLNLIVNARDAVFARDRSGESRGTIEIRSYLSGPAEVIVSVKDDGCGIPPDIVGRIFDPFFTTKDVGHGTGLGLAIAQRIALTHNGGIRVETDLMTGTLFSVWLPVPTNRESSETENS